MTRALCVAAMFLAACGRMGFDAIEDPALAPDAGVVEATPDATMTGTLPFGGLTKGRLGCASVAPLTADMSVRMSTATTMLWAWTRPGSANMIVEYRLGISTDRAELEAGLAYWISSNESPELGTPLLERYTTSWATTTGHQPSTSYVGKIVGISANGDCVETNIATATTTRQYANEVVVFADAVAPNADPQPAPYMVSSASPYRGSVHLEYVSPVDAWENLQLSQLNVSLAAVPVTAFDHAIVELALRVDASRRSAALWTVLQVELGGVLHRFDNANFVEDGMYHLFQVRLSALVDAADQPIQPARLSGGLTALGVGSGWNSGTRVCIDEIRVRW